MVREMTFNNPYYEENLYGPAKDELFVEQLKVLEGEVPQDIYGAYIRNGKYGLVTLSGGGGGGTAMIIEKLS